MAPPDHLTLRVRGLRWESDGVVSVELAHPEAGTPLPAWSPGAHVDLRLPNGIVRQYSLTGEPDTGSWRVAVLDQPGRGGSTYVHRELRPGDLLEVVGPRNHFELHDAPAYLFIAGGIGITPIMPMVRACVARGVPWTLTYCGRRRASMAFLEELATYGDRVQVVCGDRQGRIDIDAVLSGTDARSVVYCCGPVGLLDSVATRASAIGLECHTEKFQPEATPAEMRTGSGFAVLLKQSELALTVEDGESILDVVERAGVFPPASCREGTCGSCETAVISGEVDHRDGILTDDERAENRTMMICVSRARGPVLELDL